MDTQPSDISREQARTATQYLVEAEPRITKIASFGLTRAVDTAHALTEVIDTELSSDRRLRETDLGEWQERTYDEIDSTFPGMCSRWCHNLDRTPKGGETRFEVSDRMLVAIAGLTANLDWGSDTFVLASHGGATAAAAAVLLQMPCGYFNAFSDLGNTAQVEMEQCTHVNGEISWYLNAFNVKIHEREPQVFGSSGGHHAR